MMEELEPDDKPRGDAQVMKCWLQAPIPQPASYCCPWIKLPWFSRHPEYRNQIMDSGFVRVNMMPKFLRPNTPGPIPLSSVVVGGGLYSTQYTYLEGCS